MTSPCPVSVRRAGMTDQEFWDDVAPEALYPDPLEILPDDEPCWACGTTGPCGYDPAGLPLVHADEEAFQ